MMTDRELTYRHLIARSLALRAMGFDDGSPEVAPLLDECDRAWWSLSDQEHETLNREVARLNADGMSDADAARLLLAESYAEFTVSGERVTDRDRPGVTITR